VNSDEDLPEDTNSNSGQMNSNESPLVPEQGTVDLNLNKELQEPEVYNHDDHIVEGGMIPEQEDREHMSGMVVEPVNAAVVVPTVVQNSEVVVEEADDSVSLKLLLSNV